MPIRRRTPLAELRIGAQRGEGRIQAFPAADRVVGDEADDHDAEGQQDALQRVHVGHGPQAARGDVDQHDQRQQPHAEVLAHQVVGQHVEQEARGAELHAQVRDREQQRHDHREDADGVAPEVVREHLARRDVAEALADHPLPLQEHDARERNGDRVERRVGVLEAVTIDEPRMAHEGPAGE